MTIGVKFFFFWSNFAMVFGQAGNQKFFQHIEMLKMISSQQDSFLLSPAAGYENFDLMNFYDRMMGVGGGGGGSGGGNGGGGGGAQSGPGSQSGSGVQPAGPQLCKYVGLITKNTSESCQKSMQALVCGLEGFILSKTSFGFCRTSNGTLDPECEAKKEATEDSLFYTAKVFDAFGKYPWGIYTGDFLWIGTYAECLYSGAP